MPLCFTWVNYVKGKMAIINLSKLFKISDAFVFSWVSYLKGLMVFFLYLR